MNISSTRSTSRDKDWWIILPNKIQISIEKGIAQADKGETIPHEQVMKKYRSFLSGVK